MEILRRKSDYALRALSALGRLGSARAVSARRLAAQTKVAEPFLRKLLRLLARASVVSSLRGKEGGFILARSPEQISLLMAVEAVQGKLVINRCFLGHKRCARRPRCALSRRLVGVQQQVSQFFDEITLADLLYEQWGIERGTSRRTRSRIGENGGRKGIGAGR